MIPGDELAAAQKCRVASAQRWSAGDSGAGDLRTMPRLGESYLNVPVKTDEEE